MKTIYEKQIKWYHIVWYIFTHSDKDCEAFDNAITQAHSYSLDNEVAHAILFGKYSPTQALAEWDI